MPGSGRVGRRGGGGGRRGEISGEPTHKRFLPLPISIYFYEAKKLGGAKRVSRENGADTVKLFTAVSYSKKFMTN